MADDAALAKVLAGSEYVPPRLLKARQTPPDDVEFAKRLAGFKDDWNTAPTWKRALMAIPALPFAMGEGAVKSVGSGLAWGARAAGGVNAAGEPLDLSNAGAMSDEDFGGGVDLITTLAMGGLAAPPIKNALATGARTYHSSPDDGKIKSMKEPPPKTKYGFDPHDEEYETLYHGTTAAKLEAIKRKGLTTGNRALYKQSDQEAVYLSNSPDGALHWARNATAYGGKPVVVEVRVPKSSIGNVRHDNQTVSSSKSVDLRHTGPIPRDWISGHRVKASDGFWDTIDWNPPKTK